MSSFAKGDALEARAYALVEGMIAAGQFGNPDYCKTFRKKGYYSHLRKREIIFDVSVEYSLPGAPGYSLLVLIECKNLDRPVSVDDIEEFLSKKDQVFGSKGFVISVNGFQAGAVTFAESTHIGLVRILDGDKIQWEAPHSPSVAGIPRSAVSWMDVHHGLTQSEYSGQYFDCYCYSGGYYTTNVPEFFKNLIGDALAGIPELAAKLEHRAVWRPAVEYLAKERVEEVAIEVLRHVQHLEGATPLEKICEWQSESVGLKVDLSAAPGPVEVEKGILGRFSGDPLAIIVYDYGSRGHAQRRFTLAHELGHHFLGHAKHLVREYSTVGDLAPDREPEIGLEDIRRMEWQANHFASCLLLPTRAFRRSVYQLAQEHDLKDRGHGLIYVDRQRCNQTSYFLITDALMREYQVSRSVVEFRLKALGLMAGEVHSRSSIGEIFRGIGLGPSRVAPTQAAFVRRR